MSRFDETTSAVMNLLRDLKATPESPIDLFDIGVPLVAEGFTQDEIYRVISYLDSTKKIVLDGRRNTLTVTEGLL